MVGASGPNCTVLTISLAKPAERTVRRSEIGRLYDTRCRHERVRENSLRNHKANLDTNILMARCANRALKVVQCAQTTRLRHLYHRGVVKK
jgi:hypothetical protein